MSTATVQETIRQVHTGLSQAYGERTRRRHLDPVAQLVSTIISQNTNDVLRDRAYEALAERYPTWEQVRDAPESEVAASIKIAGLSQQKAPNIQAALRHISEERGELSLTFLKELPVEQAKRWLTSMRGVGPKTAAIVLLFSLDMPAFPVDTHVHRVSKRLGLIPPKTTREKAHDLLETMMPPEMYHDFHLNLIRHGREVCQARSPRCEVCLLRDVCSYYRDLVLPTIESESKEGGQG
jgi:endonuclease-3